MPLFTTEFPGLSISTGAPLGEIFPTYQNAGLLINTTGNQDLQYSPYGFPLGDLVPISVASNADGIVTVFGAQNQSDSPLAATEIDLLADDSDLASSVLAMGITSSTFDYSQFGGSLTPQVNAYIQTYSRALLLGTSGDDDLLLVTGGNQASNERMRFTGDGDTYVTGPLRTDTVKSLANYLPVLQTAYENYFTSGAIADPGYGTIVNTGGLQAFTGATVPVLPSATYDLDVTVDGGSNHQLATALLNTDDWDGIAAKLQTSLRTATGSTETVAVTGGAIVITSASTTGADDYTVILDAPVDGSIGVAGYATVSNSGDLAGFSSSQVPGITSDTYDLDVTVDGVAHPITFALLSSDSWSGIAAKIQTALRAATSSTELVAIASSKIKVTSATTGVSSTIVIAAGTAGASGGGFLAAIEALTYTSSVTIAAGTAGSGGGDLLAAMAALKSFGTLSLNPAYANIYSITPTAAVTLNAASVPSGHTFTLIVTTSGTSSYNITFGTHFKSTGVLATGTSSGKVFTIQFTSDGTNYCETNRTTAM